MVICTHTYTSIKLKPIINIFFLWLQEYNIYIASVESKKPNKYMIIHVDMNSQLKMLQLKKILFQYPFNFQKTLKIQDAPVMAMGMPGMAAPQVC